MRSNHTRATGFVGRFLGSWRLAVGELVIVALGVLVALWADQAIQARHESSPTENVCRKVSAVTHTECESAWQK